jgi:uncharacterized ferritin-like protein (DUF455 family)
MVELSSVSSTNLISLRRTDKFSCVHVITLQEAAICVLRESNVVRKASLTIDFVCAWQNGVISRVSDDYSANIDCPAEPSRPVSNDAMAPLSLLADEDVATKTKKLKTMFKKNTFECTIHAIANAESYAVDLFWDLIARYTVSHSPEAQLQVGHWHRCPALPILPLMSPHITSALTNAQSSCLSSSTTR